MSRVWLLLFAINLVACGENTTSPVGSIAKSADPGETRTGAGLAVYRFTDTQTGTIWNISGIAESGPLAGKRLGRIAGYSAYWFSWTSFWPGTAVHQRPGGAPVDPAGEQSAVALDEILGDVPIDAIPPLDRPRKDQGVANFIATRNATHVADEEIVVGVEFDGDARAYPVRILNWHEIVNHTVGSRRISLTYCPLTASGIVYDASGIEFGNSGSLYNNNMVMYDRNSRSLWSQMRGNAIAGNTVPSAVDLLPVFQGTWEAWRALYPDSQVLTQETGFSRDYRGDIYIDSGYTTSTRIWFAQMPGIDPRFHPKEMVLGLSSGSRKKAYPFSTMQDEPIVNDNFDGKDVVVVYWRDGAMAVPFSRVMDGRSLTFAPLP